MTDQIKFANDKSSGEKLVWIDFNPGNITDIAECKQRFAQAINQVIAHKDAFNQGSLTADKEMLLDEAVKRIIDAQMWAVKAITWGL